MWHSIQNFVNEKLNYKMKKKYKILVSKINKLTRDQNQQHDKKSQFYPRGVGGVNNTNIDFSNEEIAFLNKGLKYNLPCSNKYWLSNLALEAEAAIATLPVHEQEYISPDIYTIVYTIHVVLMTDVKYLFVYCNTGMGKKKKKLVCLFCSCCM